MSSDAAELESRPGVTYVNLKDSMDNHMTIESPPGSDHVITFDAPGLLTVKRDHSSVAPRGLRLNPSKPISVRK